MDHVGDFEYNNSRDWNGSDEDDAASVASPRPQSARQSVQQTNRQRSQNTAASHSESLIDIGSYGDSAPAVDNHHEDAAPAITANGRLSQSYAPSTAFNATAAFSLAATNVPRGTSDQPAAGARLPKSYNARNPASQPQQNVSLSFSRGETLRKVNPISAPVLPYRGAGRGRGRGISYSAGHRQQAPIPRNEPLHHGLPSAGPPSYELPSVALPHRGPHLPEQLPSVGRPPYRGPPGSTLCRAPRPDSHGSKSKFSAAQGVVSTRMQRQIQQRTAQANETRKFLGQPDDYEDFTGIGYYIWPDKNERATDRLGLKLEALNPIRIRFKVYIDWDDGVKCVRVRSQATLNAEESIHLAISAIRQEHEHHKSQQRISAPVHFLVPPTIENWRSQVKPILATTASEGSPVKKQTNITTLQLSGYPLPFEAMTKEKYDLARLKKLENNMAHLEANLIEKITAQSPYKGWMRMRINFGHVKITQYEKGFIDGNYSLERFENMIKQPRFTAEFDKAIGDARLAFDTMGRITSRPELFLPASPKVNHLKDVLPVHTEVLFVRGVGGQRLRIEAELDVLGDSAEEDRWYQLGTIQLYHDDKRYRVVEVRQIDIENRFDWNLDVVADDSVSEIPQSLYELVESSIQISTKERFDAYGMGYPIVLPKPIYGVYVEAVCIKSVLKYILKKEGYVVEVIIFRKWPSRDTKPEPETTCAISVGHQRWDYDMASMQGVIGERSWEETLSNFFPADQPGGNGFVDLVDKIRHIRDVLCMDGIGH